MSAPLHYLATAPFEAARQVAILPAGHRSRRLHGHSFLARVRAALPSGWAPFPGGEGGALASALTTAVADLDYRYLNDQLPVPTDENLARWLRDRLVVPGLASVGVQSTRDEGAELDGADHCHLWHRFRFEAAHRLPQVPPGHPCGRMHGHGFEVVLGAASGRGEGDRLGAVWAPFQDRLHQACLNDLEGLENPTSEHLAAWLWSRLAMELPELQQVAIHETASAGCGFDGQSYRIWKDQRFESAVWLARAPDGDRRRRLHGHSYLARLHLSAPLDEIMGWTLDFGDVSELFRPAREWLDHRRLDELAGLADGDPASLVGWIRDQVGGALPQLQRIDLYQAPGSGVVLAWGTPEPVLGQP